MKMLQSTRISLRLPRSSDATVIARLMNDRAVLRHLDPNGEIPFPYKKSDALSYFSKAKKMRRKKEALVYVIVDRASEIPMGMISLMSIDPKIGSCELGYWLGRKHWGKGSMPEAINMITHHGFHSLGLRKIWAKVLENNKASAVVLKKQGFVREAELREALLVKGKHQNELIFGLLKDEWKPYAN